MADSHQNMNKTHQTTVCVPSRQLPYNSQFTILYSQENIFFLCNDLIHNLFQINDSKQYFVSFTQINLFPAKLMFSNIFDLFVFDAPKIISMRTKLTRYFPHAKLSNEIHTLELKEIIRDKFFTPIVIHYDPNDSAAKGCLLNAKISTVKPILWKRAAHSQDQLIDFAYMCVSAFLSFSRWKLWIRNIGIQLC